MTKKDRCTKTCTYRGGANACECDLSSNLSATGMAIQAIKDEVTKPLHVEIERLRAALTDLSKGIEHHATDTVWYGQAETAVDRIAAILGGSQSETATPPSFQRRVWDWTVSCFRTPDARTPEQRAFRFVEEALELAQAVGTTHEDVARLVRYVYGRPVGSKAQEIGGVLLTLAALSESCDMNMNDCGELELARCLEKTEAIRAKDLAKPQRSPLPGSPPETESRPQGSSATHEAGAGTVERAIVGNGGSTPSPGSLCPKCGETLGPDGHHVDDLPPPLI